MNKQEQDRLKKEAAEKAAAMVKSGMVLGVGTGSTVAFFIDAEIADAPSFDVIQFFGLFNSPFSHVQ